MSRMFPLLGSLLGSTPGRRSGGGSEYTDEAAQDAIGSILTDTTSVNLTYNDSVPSITADVIFGTTGDTACVGNDSRLSDARTPTAHNHSATDITGNLPLANIAQASAASRLLGRGSAAGAGDFQEITLGSGLSMSGTALSATGSAGMASVATIAALPGSPADDDLVYVRGYGADDDGGGGIFRWDAASTATAVQGLIIGTGTGRWIRQYSGAINVRWCGAKGDGTTDDTTAINAALNAGPTQDQAGPPVDGHPVFFPAGRYLISAPLIVKSQATKLLGAGADATALVAHTTFTADAGDEERGKWLVIAEDSYLKGPSVDNLYGFEMCGFALDFQWSTDVRGIYGGGLRNGSKIANLMVRRTGLTAVYIGWGASNEHAISQGVIVDDIQEINWNVGNVQPRSEPMVWLAAANETLVANVNSSSINTYHNTGSAVQVGSEDYNYTAHNTLINCGGAYFRGVEVTVADAASFQIDELVDVTLDTDRVFTFQLKSKVGNVLKGLSGDADGIGSNYIPEVGKNAVGRTSAASSAISAATWGTAIRIHRARYTTVQLSFNELNCCGVTLDYTNYWECVGTLITPLHDYAYTSSCAVAVMRASQVTIESAIGQERIYVSASADAVRIRGNNRGEYPMNVVARGDAVVCDTGMLRNFINGYALQGGSSGNFSLFVGGETGDEPAAEWQTTPSYGILRMRNGTPLKLYGGTVAAPIPVLNVGEDGVLTVYTDGGTKAAIRTTNDEKIGFFNATAVAKPTGIGNAPQELAAALEALGLIDAKDPAVWVDSNTTLTAAHQGQLLVCNNGISLTVDNSTDFAAYGYCDIFNVGAAVTVVDTATVNKVGSLSIPQYGYARLRRTNTADAYVLTIFEAASSHTHTVDDTVDAVANQYAARNSGDTDDEARTDKRLAMWAAPITADGTYPLALWGNIPVTLTEVSARTASGTCSIKIQKGGSDINGFGIAVAQTTAVTDTASTEAIAEDAYLTIVVSSASSLTGLLVTLKGARTGN